MSPKSELHVQFAYYESSLVVEYLVGKFGFEKLTAILRDLGNGVAINDAIPKHTAPMQQIEKEFVAFAKAKAEALGPGLDWEKPEKETGLLRRIGLNRSRSSRGVDAPVKQADPNAPATNEIREASTSKPEAAPKSSGKPNYWTLLEQATRAVSEKKWADAKAPLKTLLELYPDQSGPNNAFALLAAVHRGLNEISEERAALEKWAAQEADALDAYQRLMELAEAAQDWKAVAQNAERHLAVNPLLPQPYRFLARASEALGDREPAVSAYQKLLLLDPVDPAEVHFRLARLLQATDAPAAKRHVLLALEEAPRFRDAQRLLLELAQASPVSTNFLAEPKP